MSDDRQGMSQNTNETASDDVEAHGLIANTNEIATEDDVDAHGIRLNTNETADDDD